MAYRDEIRTSGSFHVNRHAAYAFSNWAATGFGVGLAGTGLAGVLGLAGALGLVGAGLAGGLGLVGTGAGFTGAGFTGVGFAGAGLAGAAGFAGAGLTGTLGLGAGLGATAREVNRAAWPSTAAMSSFVTSGTLSIVISGSID